MIPFSVFCDIPYRSKWSVLASGPGWAVVFLACKHHQSKRKKRKKKGGESYLKLERNIICMLKQRAQFVVVSTTHWHGCQRTSFTFYCSLPPAPWRQPIFIHQTHFECQHEAKVGRAVVRKKTTLVRSYRPRIITFLLFYFIFIWGGEARWPFLICFVVFSCCCLVFSFCVWGGGLT